MRFKNRLKAASATVIAVLLLGTAAQVKAQSKDNNEIFTSVESSPDFPGGMSAFGAYLANNIRYPEADRKANVQGRVIVSFVVEKDGSLSGFKALRSPSATLSDEAVRVLAASPKWKPGYQNGRAVRTQFTVPISFSLPGLDTYKDQASPNALYVLDGKETTREEALKIVPDKIASVSVLKGEDATKKYGEKGKAGVIEITTKK